MPNRKTTSIKQKPKQVATQKATQKVTQKVVVNLNSKKTTRKRATKSNIKHTLEMNPSGNNQTIGSSGSALPYIPQMTFIPSPYNNGFIPENYKNNTDNRIQTLEGMMKTLALDYDITKNKAIQLIKQGVISPTGTNTQTPTITPSPKFRGIRNLKIKTSPPDNISFPSTSQASTPRMFNNPLFYSTPSTSSLPTSSGKTPSSSQPPKIPIPKRLFNLEDNQFYEKGKKGYTPEKK